MSHSSALGTILGIAAPGVGPAIGQAAGITPSPGTPASQAKSIAPAAAAAPQPPISPVTSGAGAPTGSATAATTPGSPSSTPSNPVLTGGGSVSAPSSGLDIQNLIKQAAGSQTGGVNVGM